MTASRETNGRFVKTDTAKAAATAAQREKLVEQLDKETESVWQHVRDMFAPMTPARSLVTFLARVTLYAVGIVSSLYVISALSIAMQLGGWPIFLVAVLEIIGFICAVVGSWMLSDTVVNYVVAGNVSRDIKRAGRWIRDRFTSTSTYVKTRAAEMVH